MRASLFVTCLGDVFFPSAAADAVRLLRSLGVEVDFPAGQTCCGQPAFNAGYQGAAREMAGRSMTLLEASVHVVVPSGSCTAMLRRYYPRLMGQEEVSPADGTGTGPRIWELSEFLVHGLGIRTLGDGLAGVRVAYHHGCHALRELHLTGEATELLVGAGAEVVRWDGADECCGFGGLFSVSFPHVSVAMADRKLDTLPPADVITSTDGGCLMQLAGRMGRKGSHLPVVPLASLLWKARGSAHSSRGEPCVAGGR